MMKQQRRITLAYLTFARHKYALLIHKLSFRIGIDKVQIEELKIQAIEELLRCMICYDGSGSFMTFFYGRLEDIFRHMRKREERNRRIQSMPIDYIENVGKNNSHIKTQECLEFLDKDEQNIITSFFFNGDTIRNISVNNGAIPSTVYRKMKEAIKKMRREFMARL